MKLAKLYHENKLILSEMKYATSTYEISKGLMFSGKNKIKKGMCLVMPSTKDVKFGASVTMMFCFSSMEIIFVNSDMEVVDKVILKPWRVSYTPKKECRYVIESVSGTFKNISKGDFVNIQII